MDEPLLKDIHQASGQAASFAAISRSSLLTTTETIAPEAARRLKGHERIVQAVCTLAKAEAQACGLSLLKIDVRPAWSHEYDEHTGIVIDVEIHATADERFLYWDAVCARFNQLEESLSPEEISFLTDEISFIVDRS